MPAFSLEPANGYGLQRTEPTTLLRLQRLLGRQWLSYYFVALVRQPSSWRCQWPVGIAGSRSFCCSPGSEL